MLWHNTTTQNKRLIRIASLSLFLSIVFTTALSFLSSFAGNIWLELFSHFKVQASLLILTFSLGLWWTRRKIFTLLSLFCLVLVLTEIITWYIPQTKVTKNLAVDIRILSSNVNTKNQKFDQILSLVRQENPDIAVFIEVNDNWIKQLNSLTDILPYSAVKANSYNLGIAVYSKSQLENTSIKFFGSSNNPSIVGNLTVNEQVISLIATHPPPPLPTIFKYRNQQLNEISQYIKTLSTKVIMVGDLNITMWSRYYKLFVDQTKLKNARQGFGILPTWPLKTTYPPYSRIPALFTWLLSIPIDHCLISPELQVVNIRTGSSIGSDHRPLIIDLAIPQTKS